MDSGALVVALVAGSLATFNPCGFGLLPAFVSLQLTEAPVEQRGLRRITRGVEVGAAVAAGFLAVFAIAAIPIALGATALAAYFSWAGLLVGLTLVVVAVLGLAGKRIRFSIHRKADAPPTRPGFIAFGIGYGTASLGCTLPVLLALIGAATTSGNPIGFAGTFAAYGIGTMTTLIAIAVAVAGARAGLVTRIKRLIPHMHRLSSMLLLAAGVYVTYYWGRILLDGPAATGSDRVIGLVAGAAAALERAGAAHGLPLIIIAGSISLMAIGVRIAQRSSRSRESSARR